MSTTPSAAGSGTITAHRVLTSTPEKIWRAFTQPDAFARWLPPNGFVAHVYGMDVKVGGSYRMSFTNFTTGGEMFFGGNYLELRENEGIAYTASFEDANLPGEMTTRVTIKPVSVGVEIHITQSGIPAVIPTEACYLGWQESLRHLARLVEPNIPG
ncbi:MAG: SRPBCC family protein [Pseudomonadota bacterium]